LEHNTHDKPHGKDSVMAIRTVAQARNPKWGNQDKTYILVEVDFDELDEDWVSFAASVDDPEEHGRQIFQDCIDGVYGEVADFEIPEEISGDRAMDELRSVRTSALERSDYIEMPTKWNSLTAEQQQEWATYRQSLRDITTNYPNAKKVYDVDVKDYVWKDVVFPTSP